MAGFRGKGLYLSIRVSGVLLALLSGLPALVRAQFATSDRLSQSGFWPTQTRYPRNEYTGAAACAECHKLVFERAQQTSMAHSAMLAGESSILKSNPDLGFSNGSYRYDIRTTDGTSIYSVINGVTQQSALLVWAFGTSRTAQSYLFRKKDGEFHEARVTYFRSLAALDFTPGRALASATDIAIDDAMDRQVGRAEVYRCFACHTTGSRTGDDFDETKLIPGVTCEACHGPGGQHVAQMEVGNSSPADSENGPGAIFNPKKLTPEESVDFCGSCHGSYWDVSLSGASGVGNARFQPYRLEQSKCWNKNDARLTCIACHDPHKEVETEASAYDHVCLSCHLTSESKAKTATMQKEKARLLQENLAKTHPGAACPVSIRECTSCHMPQVYVPAMHTAFPDHRIRIVREREPFPD
jgi:hypothetical protein